MTKMMIGPYSQSFYLLFFYFLYVDCVSGKKGAQNFEGSFVIVNLLGIFLFFILVGGYFLVDIIFIRGIIVFFFAFMSKPKLWGVV